MRKVPQLTCALRTLRYAGRTYQPTRTICIVNAVIFYVTFIIGLMALPTAMARSPPGAFRKINTVYEIGSNFNLTCELGTGKDVTKVRMEYFNMFTHSITHTWNLTSNNNQMNAKLQAIDDYTVVLEIRNATEQKGHYTCLCDNKAIDKIDIYVGTPPLPVTNFDCRLYDFDYIECNFSNPYNAIPTDYTLQDSMNKYNCRLHAPALEQYECKSPKLVRTAEMQRNFTINGKNSLSSRNDNYRIDMSKKVIPKLDAVEFENIAAHSIDIKWFLTNNAMYDKKTNGVLYEVAYRTKPTDSWNAELLTLSDIQLMGNNKFKATLRLPYANFEYDVGIRAKANSTSNITSMWSKWIQIKCRTLPIKPSYPPRTAIGSYYIRNVNITPELQLYWGEIEQPEQNGNGFYYNIIQQDDNGHTISRNKTTVSSFVLPWMNKTEPYNFYISAVNEIGESEQRSLIRVYPLKKEIINLKPTVYNTTLQWQLPDNYNEVTNYTVFYCLSDTNSLTQCKGSITYEENIPKTTTKFELKSNHRNIMAVAANYEDYTTGMQWQQCSSDITTELSTPNLKVSPINATALNIEWELKAYICTSVLHDYTLVYWENQEKTIQKIPKDRQSMVIGQLKPFTDYSMYLILNTNTGLRIESKTRTQCTEQAAPSPPRQLKFIESTKTSQQVNITWQPPEYVNGILTSYTINIQPLESAEPNQLIKVPVNDMRLEQLPDGTINYQLTNLQSDMTYIISVQANTVAPSESRNITLHTLLAPPPKPDGLRIPPTNAELIWKRPDIIKTDRKVYYLIALMRYKKDDRNDPGSLFKRTIVSTNVCKFEENVCYDIEYNYQMKVQAIMLAKQSEIDRSLSNEMLFNLRNGDLELDAMLCSNSIEPPTLPDEQNVFLYSPMEEILYSNGCNMSVGTINLFFFVGTFISLGMFGLGYVVYKKCRRMQNIKIILPEGLTYENPGKCDNILNPYDTRKNNVHLDTPEITRDAHDCFHFNQHDNTTLLQSKAAEITKSKGLRAPSATASTDIDVFATELITNYEKDFNDQSMQDVEKTSPNTTSSLVSHNSDTCSIASSEHESTECLVACVGNYTTVADLKKMSALANPDDHLNTNTISDANKMLMANAADIIKANYDKDVIDQRLHEPTEKISPNASLSMVSHNSDTCSIALSEHEGTDCLVAYNDDAKHMYMPAQQPVINSFGYVTQEDLNKMSALAKLDEPANANNISGVTPAPMQMNGSCYIKESALKMMSAMPMTNGHMDYIKFDAHGKPILPAFNNMTNDVIKAPLDLNRKNLLTEPPIQANTTTDITATAVMPRTPTMDTLTATSVADKRQMPALGANASTLAMQIPSAIQHDHNNTTNNAHNTITNTNNTNATNASHNASNLNTNINGYVTQKQLAEFCKQQQ